MNEVLRADFILKHATSPQSLAQCRPCKAQFNSIPGSSLALQHFDSDPRTTLKYGSQVKQGTDHGFLITVHANTRFTHPCGSGTPVRHARAAGGS